MPLSNLTMDDLYEEMKEVLRYLGLSFHEKHKVNVVFREGEVIFTYKERHVAIKGMEK